MTKHDTLQFAIAKSSNGTVGLVTSKTSVLHTYPDGNQSEVWTGVVIQKNVFQGHVDRGSSPENQITANVGDFWCSSKPVVIGYLDGNKITRLLSPEDYKKL